jgi:DNA-directed RNA polymerase subunit omega
MNIVYIEAAAKVIPNKQQLINMVSKRVRQLSAGSRPMVETNLSMGLSDIALAEIAEGKLTMETTFVIDNEDQAA